MSEMQKVLDLAESIQKDFHNFKKENNEKLEQIEKGSTGTAEFEQKLSNISESIAKAAEEKQVVEARLKALESLSNQSVGEQKQSELEEQREKATELIKEFSQKNFNGEFGQFLDMKGIEKKELSTVIDPDGGFLINSVMGGLLKTRQFETSPMRQIADVVSIGSDAIEYVIDNDEAAHGGWVSEKATRSESNTPTFDKKRIEVFEHYCEPHATQTMLDDVTVNIESWLSEKVAAKMSRIENTAFVSGSGVGQPRGFADYSTNWATAGTYESGALEQIASGSASALTADGLIDLQNSLLEFYQPNASFVLKRSSVKEILKLKTGDGEYLFNRNLDKNAGSAFSLLGRPMILANDMPAIAANALAIAYGDFREGYKIVDRQGIRVLRDPYTSKPYVKFYTTKRVGGDVVNYEAIKLLKVAASV